MSDPEDNDEDPEDYSDQIYRELRETAEDFGTHMDRAIREGASDKDIAEQLDENSGEMLVALIRVRLEKSDSNYAEMLRLLTEHTDGPEAMKGPGAFAMQLETMAMMLENMPMLVKLWETDPKGMRNHLTGLRIRVGEMRDLIRKIVPKEEWESAAEADTEKTDGADEDGNEEHDRA